MLPCAQESQKHHGAKRTLLEGGPQALNLQRTRKRPAHTQHSAKTAVREVSSGTPAALASLPLRVLVVVVIGGKAVYY